MSLLRGFAVLLLLGGCTVEDHSAVEPVRKNWAPAGCPTIPSVPTVVVSGELGPDFWTCKAVDKTTNEELFQIYVGNQPGTPETKFKYGGVTRSSYGNLTWFMVTGAVRTDPWTWYSYIPTEYEAMSVMVVSFTAKYPEPFKQRADLVARLRFQQ